MRDRTIIRAGEREPSPAPRSRSLRREVHPKEFIAVAASDVVWWAETAQREPFISAANRIRRSQTPVKHILWPIEGDMVIVYAEKPKARRRE